MATVSPRPDADSNMSPSFMSRDDPRTRPRCGYGRRRPPTAREHARDVPLGLQVVGGAVVSVALQRGVLRAIADHADPDGSGAFPCIATIARRTGCSVRSAQRGVRALEQAGIIVTVVGGGRLSNLYMILMSGRPETPGPSDDRHVAAPTTPCRTTSTYTKKIKSGSARVRETPSRCASVSTRTPPRSSRPRGRHIPDDLRPLADALAARGLRAAYALDDRDADEVRAIIARVGIPRMVEAAYRSHRRDDPARWWSAWTGLWSGLHVPAQRRPTDAVTAPVGVAGPTPDAVRLSTRTGPLSADTATTIAATRTLLARRVGHVPVGVPARSARVGAGPRRSMLGDPGLDVVGTPHADVPDLADGLRETVAVGELTDTLGADSEAACDVFRGPQLRHNVRIHPDTLLAQSPTLH